jgi:hypothetical protein
MWFIFSIVDVLLFNQIDLFNSFTIIIRRYTETLIREKINKASVMVNMDQLLSLSIKIHFPRNIEEGGKPPKLILNLIELGQTMVLTKAPVSFFRSSDIMKITDR